MMTAQEKLERAIVTGNNLKPDLVLGKEYYVLWIPEGNDEILEFIYAKVKAFYPNLAENFSAVGVFWELHRIQPGMFRYDRDSGVCSIHKREFKRHLKKAIIRSRSRS